MCGIAGIWYLNKQEIALEALKTFTDSIAHRGPDGAGYELLEDRTLGFGHRRLSILDLSEAGKQPMFHPGGNLVITYNGEVYNFIEIRTELKTLGHQFKTDTDTEVILSAYTQWGIDCFDRFNGMFAIGIWDVNTKELLLVRDRFGVKPLYFLHLPEQVFAFCSETIGFKHLKDFKRTVNAELLGLSLQQPEVIEGTDKTIFNHIFQLLPGHFLKMKSDESPRVSAWWDTKKNLVPVPESYEDQVREFKRLFEESCKIRMRSDVTLASALSGGLDSSSVYCTLHRLNSGASTVERLPNNWQQAFVATFPGTSVDEKKYAEKVVQHIGGKAQYIVPDYNNLVQDITEATRLFDGIIATPITSISDIYKSMRQNGVTVSMDGHGADEMMYGYRSYVFNAFYDALQRRDFAKAKEYAAIICGLSPDYQMADFNKIIKQFDRSIVEKGFSFLKNRLQNKQAVKGPAEIKAAWYHTPADELLRKFSALESVPEAWSNSEKIMYADFHYKSLPINLRDFDRAAMQHGVEIRMPFMDYRLVSYVFSLPISAKLGQGFTKRILRDAMKGTLPEDIRTRTLKIGIGAPMEEWFNHQLKTYILDTIRSKSFLDSPYWHGKEMAADVENAYVKNTLDKALCQKIWTVINANIILE